MKLLKDDPVVTAKLYEHEMTMLRAEFKRQWEITMARWVPDNSSRQQHAAFCQMAWIAFLAGKRSRNDN